MNFLDQAIANTTNQFHPAIVNKGPVESIAERIEANKTDTRNYADIESNFFIVEEQPISSKYGVIKGTKGIFVNEKKINIVSNRYEVHQPLEVLNKFYDVADRTNLRVNKVITNPTNGGLLISANYSGTRIVGEQHDVNVIFYTSHCGSYKSFLTLSLLRIACDNQVPVLYRNKDRHIISKKHYTDALNLEEIAAKLEHIPGSVQSYNEKAHKLQEKHLSFLDFIDLYNTTYKVDTSAKRYNSKLAALSDVYYNAKGQRELAQTAYKAYQAVTYENTHKLRETALKQENIITRNGDKSLEFVKVLLAA